MIFRFDDVCVNSDMELHNQLTDYLFEKFPKCEIIWAVSPLVHSSEKETQRVFPKEWNALSAFQNHYFLDKMGIPAIHPKVRVATHGLCHVDHRLLSIEAQEMSIAISASLVGAKIFVPPFNKWNKDTEKACGYMKLIKYEHGWRSMEHNKYTSKQWRCGENGKSYLDQQWYLHAREWTIESFKAWFENGS